MEESLRICCCYAHTDRSLLEGLKRYLLPLQRANLFDIWTDADISPGSLWEKEIKDQLDTSQIILLLVSANFLSSEYCYSKEMQYALERHRSGRARAIPIIVRPCLWMSTPLVDLQALPQYAIPVVSNSWSSQDEAFLSIADGLRQVIEELSPGIQGTLSPETLAATTIFHGNVPRIVANAVQALDSIDPQQRLYGLDTLGRMTHPVAREALVGALNHPVQDVRIHAAAQWLKQDLRAIPVLTEMLYLQPIMPPGFEDYLLRERTDRLRLLAIQALCQMGEPAFLTLIEALSHYDVRVRGEALEELRRRADPRAVPSLVERLADSEEHIRTQASWAISGMGEAAFPCLTRIFQDGEAGARHSVLLFLLSETKRSPWCDVDYAATAAILQKRENESMPALIQALHNENSLMRLAAVNILGIWQDSQAVPVLIQALGDGYDKVREAAGNALGAWQDKQQVVFALIQALHDKNNYVCEAAGNILGAWQDSQAVSALIQALHDGKYYVREEARKSLLRLTTVNSIDDMVKLLERLNCLHEEECNRATLDLARLWNTRYTQARE